MRVVGAGSARELASDSKSTFDIQRAARCAFRPMIALHAASVDPRITRVMVENSLVSYRTAMDAPLHRNLSEITIPAVLNHYDVNQLLEAIAPRAVTLLNPVDAIGQPVRAEQVRDRLYAAFQSDKNLGYPQRIRVLRRGFRDPLPIE